MTCDNNCEKCEFGRCYQCKKGFNMVDDHKTMKQYCLGEQFVYFIKGFGKVGAGKKLDKNVEKLEGKYNSSPFKFLNY